MRIGERHLLLFRIPAADGNHRQDCFEYSSSRTHQSSPGQLY